MTRLQAQGFEIQLPDNYLDLSTYVFALPPSQRFQPSVVVKMEVREERPTLGSYAAQQIHRLDENLQNFKILSQIPIKEGDRECVATVFEWGPVSEAERIRQKQWYVPAAGRSVFYTFTATNLAADFEETETLFHAIFRSFTPR